MTDMTATIARIERHRADADYYVALLTHSRNRYYQLMRGKNREEAARERARFDQLANNAEEVLHETTR